MNQDPLAQLHDIHLPTPSPWWDLAVGWWILLALCVLALFFVTPKLWQKWQVWRKQRALKQTIHAEYQRICDAYAADKHGKTLVSDINTLLRRVALSVFPEQPIAGLIGQDWLCFLDQAWQDKPSPSFIDQPFADVLLQSAYQADVCMDEPQAQALCDLVQAWLKAVVRYV